MSKGSTPRRRQVDRAEYERRWAETFGPSYSRDRDILETAKARVTAQILSGVRKYVPNSGGLTYAEPDATGHP